MASLNGVNLPKLGVQYDSILRDVECDQRIKNVIYQLANDLHETDKRLNSAIETIIAFSEALYAVGLLQERLENKMYKKQNQNN